jgi:hypothetical protein
MILPSGTISPSPFSAKISPVWEEYGTGTVPLPMARPTSNFSLASASMPARTTCVDPLSRRVRTWGGAASAAFSAAPRLASFGLSDLSMPPKAAFKVAAIMSILCSRVAFGCCTSSWMMWPSFLAASAVGELLLVCSATCCSS